MAETKKLYRSSTDKMLAGVCGGMGEYSGIDSTIIRLIWVAVILFSGFFPGIVAYIVAALVIPEKPGKKAPLKPSVIPPKTV